MLLTCYLIKGVIAYQPVPREGDGMPLSRMQADVSTQGMGGSRVCTRHEPCQTDGWRETMLKRDAVRQEG